jgi:hypothetical protein
VHVWGGGGGLREYLRRLELKPELKQIFSFSRNLFGFRKQVVWLQYVKKSVKLELTFLRK